ncbi:MAG: GNAT family N-acetyltransferase [Halioglobus sp.]|nr:GNAT family N-acetyltransferase [Hyphomonas sp.]MCB1674642.1 GNAT family N-acetyltransferase [Halioglobus sp.]
MPMVWRSVRENFRQLGGANALLYLVDRVLRAITGSRARLVRYLLVAQPVPADPVEAMRQSLASKVREVGGDDPVVKYFPRPAAVIARRFADGSVCYVAEVRDRFAGYLWLAFNGYDEDEVRCRYEFAEPALSAWDYDVYVEPDFRLGRTFARLWETANQRLANRGVRWSFSRISAFNAGSLAAHRHMGLQTLFAATFVCLGPLQLTFTGTAPFVHLSFSDKSRPVLRLSPGVRR